MLKHCWELKSPDRKFPTKHRCPTCQLPPKCDLYRKRESVCGSVFGRCCRKTYLSGEGHAAGQAAAQELLIGRSLSRRCPPTYHWPGTPCPRWLRGRGSSGWLRRVSSGGQWQLSWPGQSPGSSVCSRTSPQCCWASGPGQKTQHKPD